ncbi:MAG TPA: copper-binding protein [Burkholderiales bacterium]|nr:copper-binding protein [Burkholderiales bacterium]
MNRSGHALALLLCVAFTCSTLHAIETHAAQQQPAQAYEMTDGEIRLVNRDAKKLTIRHGPIHNLGMPAMTMVFLVNDAGLLDKVKTGDRIKFFAERINGAITVVAIELAK